MSDYTKSVDFAAKDALSTGNPAKIAKGTEIDTEFNNIATAIATKYDAGDTLLAANGSLSAPSISFSTDTDTGLFLLTTNTMNLVVGGDDIATFRSDKKLVFGQWNINEVQAERMQLWGEAATPAPYLSLNMSSSTSALHPKLLFRKVAADTIGNWGQLSSGHVIGRIELEAPAVSTYVFSTCGAIEFVVDGTVSGNTTPTRMGFITENTSGSQVEAMRITSAQELLVGITSPTSGGAKLQVKDGITFPATQSASSNANTLDDYEEGTFTPALTFTTPGDLSVTYSIQEGTYQKIGNRVTCTVRITTSSFTHSTASGNARITTLPFSSASSAAAGALSWQGITKTSYTQIVVRPEPSLNQANLIASGSGQAMDNVTAADMPSGGTVLLQSTFTYTTAN